MRKKPLRTETAGIPQLVEKAVDISLIFGATTRLTRLITLDDLGQWWVVDPLISRAENTRWWKYVDGLTCPFCVGFHLSLMVIMSYLAARRLGGPALVAWRAAAGALTVNYGSAHLVVAADFGEE